MLTDESDDEHVSIIFITFWNLLWNICKKIGNIVRRKRCLCASLLSVGEILTRSSWIHLLPSWKRKKVDTLLTSVCFVPLRITKLVHCPRLPSEFSCFVKSQCRCSGLEITVSHQTLSDQILNMSGQFHILIGHDVRTFHQHPLSIHKIWLYKLLKRLKVVTGTVANAAKISSLATKNSGLVDNWKYVCVHRLP